MQSKNIRVEKDSLGTVNVPAGARYGAQTQRAVDNFQISQLRLPREFILSVAMIKSVAAQVNEQLGLLDSARSLAIQNAVADITKNYLPDEFPVDIFQTGSGTSTNMNVNEVIAHICNADGDVEVHPNDHVNMGQSSNDVIPTAIQVSVAIQVHEKVIPSLLHLKKTIDDKSNELSTVVKTGRTHLMDAMPLTFGQELSAWSSQIQDCLDELTRFMPGFQALAQGGTAVGSGINTHSRFAVLFAEKISLAASIDFSPSDNFFKSISSQDASVALSGKLKHAATAMYKISNDLRLMNSGPLSGIGDIELKALQPGSSIMPGKVNPVIPEAVAMVCTQIIGNDATISLAGLSGNFQLNVMLPVVAYNLIQSTELLANSAVHLADLAIKDFSVMTENIERSLSRNPILVTALNPVIGYEAAAAIAKEAYRSKRPVIEVALERTDLQEEELLKLLNPIRLSQGGLIE